VLGFVSLHVSSEMIHALLPIYLITVLGTSALTVGIIEGVAEATASIGGVALLAASVIAGGLRDAAGPQGTFLAGAAFTPLALLGLAAIRGRLARPNPS
jgi:hypothetical protein